MSRAQDLADIPLFALLDDEDRATLAERVDLVQLPAGQVVFSIGDPGDAMYIVTSGAVELSFKNDTGDKILLETARKGDYFGEISLLDAGPRSATATVLEDTEVLVVDQGDLAELIRLRPGATMDLLGAFGRRLRETSKLLRHTTARNVNIADEDKRTVVMKIADWISDFSGSLPFLFIHIVLFTIWIVLNIQPLAQLSIGNFDPFPFGLLTMAVSLEAIVLSVFVLLSQNRQASRERVRNDIEFEINLKAELQISHMHEKIDEIHAELLKRLDRIEGGHPAKSLVPGQ